MPAQGPVEGVAVDVGPGVTLVLLVTADDVLPVAVGLPLVDAEWLADPDVLAVALDVGELTFVLARAASELGQPLVGVGLTVWVTVTRGVDVGLAVLVTVTVTAGLTVTVAVPLGLAVPVAVALALPLAPVEVATPFVLVLVVCPVELDFAEPDFGAL